MMNYYGYDMMGGWGNFHDDYPIILIVIIVYAVMKLVPRMLIMLAQLQMAGMSKT